MIYKRIITKKLGKLLLERKIITQHQLEEALWLQKQEGGFLSRVLLKLGFVTEADIASCLSNQYGFPYLPLANYTIEPKIIKLVPAELARQCDLVPIDKVGDILTVVMVDPLNLNAIEELKVITDCKIQAFIGTASDVTSAVLRYYGPQKDAERKEKADVIAPLAPQKFINLKTKDGLEKRRFVRLNASLDFHYAFQEEYLKAKTKNISAIGILFVSENFVPLWTFLVIKIRIPGTKLPIRAVGQVIRIETLSDLGYDVAVHLTHVDKSDRAKLNHYILEHLAILPDDAKQ
ncbi:MAG: PilZ domain-containing protein [Candidatus Omnitrophota bacterium]